MRSFGRQPVLSVHALVAALGVILVGPGCETSGEGVDGSGGSAQGGAGADEAGVGGELSLGGSVTSGGLSGNGGVENGGVENGGVENGGVENGGVENGGVENGGVENAGASGQSSGGMPTGGLGGAEGSGGAASAWGGTGNGGTTSGGQSMGGAAARCGDGRLDDGEQCDDGNAVVTDGCDDLCRVGEGYTCQGNPSTCAIRCGDGIRALVEECDDGNQQRGDGCSPQCKLSVLTAGGGHTCVLLADNSLRCWGAGEHGQLGSGVIHIYATGSTIPLRVSSLTQVAGIAAGQVHTCAVLSDGTLRCWGSGFTGLLGDGSLHIEYPQNIPTPVRVLDITNATQIAAGGHTCALLETGAMRCWGPGDFGQLGDGVFHTVNVPTPTPVSLFTQAVQIAVGGAHTCALLSDHTVSCWGRGSWGQLGNGVVFTDPPFGAAVPVTVQALEGVAALAAGAAHSCALLGDGTVQCWGQGDRGQLGDGSLHADGVATPISVSSITGAVQVAAGDAHTCALLADGAVRCWGDGSQGQLGDGSFHSTGVANPVAVSVPSRAVQIAAGGAHTCAILDDQTVFCWGSAAGHALGDALRDSALPVAIRGFPNDGSGAGEAVCMPNPIPFGIYTLELHNELDYCRKSDFTCTPEQRADGTGTLVIGRFDQLVDEPGADDASSRLYARLSTPTLHLKTSSGREEYYDVFEVWYPASGQTQSYWQPGTGDPWIRLIGETCPRATWPAALTYTYIDIELESGRITNFSRNCVDDTYDSVYYQGRTTGSGTRVGPAPNPICSAEAP